MSLRSMVRKISRLKQPYFDQIVEKIKVSIFLILNIMIDQIIAFNKTFVAQKGYETHPLVPKDIVVRGFIIDSETGALEEIER